MTATVLNGASILKKYFFTLRKMKRLSFFVIFSIVFFNETHGASFEKDSILFLYWSDSVATVAKVLNSDVNKLVIPSVINYGGKSFDVKYIYPEALLGCSELKEIVIPSSIEEVALDLFENCPFLTDVYVSWNNPDTIRFIETHNEKNDYDFIRHIVNLHLHVPNGLIERYLKIGYPWIGFRTVSDETEIISVQSFVSAEGDIYNISDHNRNEVFGVFSERKGFFEVPKAVFSEDSGLTYKVVGLGCRAFYSNDGVKEVLLPNSIIEIGTQAFEKCENLVSVIMSDSIRIISHYAFGKCTKLLIDSLPEHLSFIGNFAFYGCDSIQSIYMPNNVEQIANSSFAACKRLKEITLNGKLTYMGQCCFMDCAVLESVCIPPSLELIGNRAFEGCNGLKKVVVLSDVPLLIDRGLLGEKDIILYVPKGSKAKYRTAPGWKDVKEIKKIKKNSINSWNIN